MNQIEFENKRNEEMQKYLLTPKAISEEISYGRNWDYSWKRVQMDEYKMQMRQRTTNFVVVKNSINIQVRDGNDKIRRDECLFKCRIDDIRKYVMDGTDQVLFQVIIRATNGERVEGSPYDASLLESPKRLQGTFLYKYDKTVNQQDKKMLWEYLWKEIKERFDNEKPIILPGRPGWYLEEGKWKFVEGARNKNVLNTREISTYYLRYISKEADEAIEIPEYDKKQEEIMGVLMLIRLCGVIGSLLSGEPFKTPIILYGRGSLETARKLLCVSQQPDNVINLNMDRISSIRQKLENIKSENIIFNVDIKGSRSAKEKYKQIMSEVTTGYMDFVNESVPIIFCMRNLSTESIMSEAVYIDTSMVVPNLWEESFDQIQSRWIDLIEKSGTVVKDQLQKYMEESDTENTLEKLCTVIVAGTAFFLGEKVEIKLQTILEKGRELVRRQIAEYENHDILMFRDKVQEYASGHKLSFYFKEKDIPRSDGKWNVFYDDDFYYFSNEVLSKICEEASISSKMFLYVKKSLAIQGYLKTYRCVNGEGEFFVDIGVMKEGKRNHLSAMAIQRKFFENRYGIQLFERG